MSIPEDCLYDLFKLKREIDWWYSGHEKIRRKLEWMMRFSQDMVRKQGASSEAAMIIIPKLQSLQGEITESVLDEFREAAEDACKILKNDPNKDDSGSFYNTLHPFMNIILASLSNLREVRKIIGRCLDKLKENLADKDVQSLLQKLEPCFKNVENEVITESILSSILSCCQNVIPKELPQPRSREVLTTYPTTIRQVIIIEDQEVWSEPLRKEIAEEFPDLRDKIFCWRTYNEACEGLEALRNLKREQREGVLVILDLGLPKDQIELNLGKSSRALGKDLLSRLRSYALNVRTILLTSHFDFLEDHRWALSQGIAPEDYIWKGVKDYRERVKSCIRRMMETERGISKIEIYERDDGSGQVTIDDVEIQFDSLYFRTFSVLCNQRYPKSCDEILTYLKNDYTDDYYKTLDPETIHDHIYNIRKGIYEAFNKAGRSVNSYLIIQTVHYNVKKYQIRRGIKIHRLDDEEVGYPISTSVLVVEDDPTWCRMTEEFLTELGYKVEVACSVKGAVNKVKKAVNKGDLAPAILCLDMHIPETQEESSESGQIENGFKALETIRKILDDIGVVVLTHHYEKNDLRDLAMQKGIDINHWVGKDENWKNNLAYAVWRLAREFLLGVKTPTEDDIYSHLRIQLNESNKRIILIDGIEIGLTEKRSKLIWALAESRTPVPRRNILSSVYGEDPNKEKALNSLVDDTRRCIAKALQKVGKNLDPKKIINETPDGYRLKGLIFIS